MATEKTLITHLSKVGQSQYLLKMFLGRIAVAKGILVPNMNFARTWDERVIKF